MLYHYFFDTTCFIIILKCKKGNFLVSWIYLSENFQTARCKPVLWWCDESLDSAPSLYPLSLRRLFCPFSFVVRHSSMPFAEICSRLGQSSVSSFIEVTVRAGGFWGWFWNGRCRRGFIWTFPDLFGLLVLPPRLLFRLVYVVRWYCEGGVFVFWSLCLLCSGFGFSSPVIPSPAGYAVSCFGGPGLQSCLVRCQIRPSHWCLSSMFCCVLGVPFSLPVAIPCFCCRRFGGCRDWCQFLADLLVAFFSSWMPLPASLWLVLVVAVCWLGELVFSVWWSRCFAASVLEVMLWGLFGGVVEWWCRTVFAMVVLVFGGGVARPL
jgi:hypothetical protein